MELREAFAGARVGVLADLGVEEVETLQKEVARLQGELASRRILPCWRDAVLTTRPLVACAPSPVAGDRPSCPPEVHASAGAVAVPVEEQRSDKEPEESARKEALLASIDRKVKEEEERFNASRDRVPASGTAAEPSLHRPDVDPAQGADLEKTQGAGVGEKSRPPSRRALTFANLTELDTLFYTAEEDLPQDVGGKGIPRGFRPLPGESVNDIPNPS